MDRKFAALIGVIVQKYEELMRMELVSCSEVPNGTPIGGVYVFYEGGQPLYVGKTKKSISTRLRIHFCNSPDAPFAYNIAREKTGLQKRYNRETSRTKLKKHEQFQAEFKVAKQRIKNMNVRYVHEPDPLLRTLLEIYTAVILETPYNFFDRD
jgi:hypothetical protein